MPTLFGTAKKPSFSLEHYRQKFIQLSDEHKKALAEIKRDIKNPKLKMNFSETELGGYNRSSVYKLGENDHTFKELCQHDEYPHVKAWSEKLKEEGQVYYELVSLDGDDVISIYDQHVGAFFETQIILMEDEEVKNPGAMDKYAREFLIDEACKHKTYFGFYTRAEDLAALIKKENDFSTFSKYSEYADKLDRTLKEMSNCYMTFGHLYSASLYAEIAQHFEKEEMPGLAAIFYEKAIKKFFGGEYLLQMHNDNVKKHEDRNHLEDDFALIDIVSQGRGFAYFGYSSPDQARNVLMKKQSPQVDTVKLQIKVRHKIDEKLGCRERRIKNLPTPAVGRM